MVDFSRLHPVPVLVLLLTSHLPAIGSAQAGIHLGGGVHISADAARAPHAESFLAMHPADPARMVATSVVFDGDETQSSVYVSRDRGRTWRRVTADSTLPQLDGGDPIVDFTTGGAALFGAIEGQPDGFRVWRSSDGGQRWNGMTTVPGGIYDRQYLAVDRTSGRFRGRIYAVGTILIRKTDGRRHPAVAVSASTDDGATFHPATIIDVTSGGQHIHGGVADPVVTRDGALVLPYVTASRLFVVVSRDGGRTFTPPRPGPEIGMGSDFRSIRTLSNRHTALDTSDGPFTGRLYVSWVDFARDRYDVKVVYSDDLGLTWSVPATVNDKAEPTDPSNAAIAVNRDGVVAVIFNDRRDDPRRACYRLYVSASLDGGERFLPNVQVNPKPTCPGAPGNWPGIIRASERSNIDGSNPYHEISLTGVPERFPNGGETQGLIAGPDGRFHVAWINGESGVMQLWYTDFAVRGAVRRARVERSADLEVVARDPVIDFSRKSVSFSVQLRNVSGDSIAGPVALVLDGFDSGLGGLAPANADTSGRVSRWVFTLGRSGRLLPGELSELRELRWRFDGEMPAEPEQRFRGRFRIFQETGTALRR